MGPWATLPLIPTGAAIPLVSTLNAIGGQVTANAAIVPAGTNGDIDVFAADDTDLVIDINGYFAPSGAGRAFVVQRDTLPCAGHAEPAESGTI